MINMSVAEFLAARKEPYGPGLKPGVYVLKNKETGQAYVGQSTCPSQRVFTHLSGRGNGDVYMDVQLGDRFDVCFYALDDAQFHDLNELEVHMIRIFEADTKGYNRQSGNRCRNAS